MIKKLVITVVVLLVVVVGGVFFYLDSIVKSGIEVVGSDVLGSEVRVSGVSLSPFSGGGSISGLTIANPEGFERDYAFELGEVSMQLNVGSITSDVIEISSIVIDSPHITYETNLRNDNIRTLLANISGDDGSAEPADSSGSGKDLLIREFRMINPQLDVITQVASAPISLPDIVINDIGTGGEGGASAAEVLSMVLGRINRAIVEGNFPSVEALRDRLGDVEDEARQAVDDAVQDLGSRLRDILN